MVMFQKKITSSLTVLLNKGLDLAAMGYIITVFSVAELFEELKGPSYVPKKRSGDSNKG